MSCGADADLAARAAGKHTESIPKGSVATSG